MKKILVSVILVICLLISNFSGHAAPRAEAATALALNKEYSESICHEQKVYTFKMPSTGYFYYTITPIYYTTDGVKGDSTTWWINHQMYVNYKQYENNKAYYSEGTWRSFRYNFKKGTTIQIKINEESDVTNVWYYKIKITTGKVKNFEQENNGTRAKANTLKANKAYTGNMLKDDIDYWVFKVPKTGKYKISGVVSDNDYYGSESKRSNQAYLNAVAYLGYKQKNSVSIDETSGYKTLFKGKVKKGKKIYIKVQYDNWYDVFYKIKVKKIK